MQWVLLPFKRYFDFQGRSRRMEFWMFALLNVLVAIILVGLAVAVAPSTSSSEVFSDSDSFSASAGFTSQVGDSLFSTALTIIYGIYFLVAIIPSISVTVRRFHDRDMSGWWYLGVLVLSIIPLIGTLVWLAFLVMMLLPGTPGPNRFGSDPKGRGDASVFE